MRGRWLTAAWARPPRGDEKSVDRTSSTKDAAAPLAILFPTDTDARAPLAFDDASAVLEGERSGALLVNADRADRYGACEAFLAHARAAADRLAVIVRVAPGDVRFAARAIRLGAFDVVDAEAGLEDVVLAALRRLRRPSHAAGAFAQPFDLCAAHEARAALTDRQREILERIVQGQPNKRIAAELGISQRTAENHRAVIMRKLGASSASRLIQIALAA